jgi:hypothetical protein
LPSEQSAPSESDLDWGIFRHVAVVVDDLDAATEELKALGLPELQTSTNRVRRYWWIESGELELSMNIVWTRMGGLTLELIQAIPGSGIFEPKGRAYLHHLSFGIDDVAGERRKWEGRGYENLFQWAGANPGFSYFRLFGGVLSDFLDNGRPYPAGPLLES